jgi:hypothetical protein
MFKFFCELLMFDYWFGSGRVRRQVREAQINWVHGFKKRSDAYIAWAKQNRDHPIVQSVEAQLGQLYANLLLTEQERVQLIANVLDNGYRLMCEAAISTKDYND